MKFPTAIPQKFASADFTEWHRWNPRICLGTCPKTTGLELEYRLTEFQKGPSLEHLTYFESSASSFAQRD